MSYLALASFIPMLSSSSVKSTSSPPSSFHSISITVRRTSSSRDAGPPAVSASPSAWGGRGGAERWDGGFHASVEGVVGRNGHVVYI